MKLLIITQKVDQNDDVLGFFHGWIREFAKHYEKITVICLEKGEYDLPANVKVLSLGKEKPQPTILRQSLPAGQAGSGQAYNLQPLKKLKYSFNFLRYIWRFYYSIIKYSRDYDAVFVHMNQEYVLLGGLPWKILGKKVAMWRNHYAGNIFTRIAMMMADKIFCTSKYSFTAQSKKAALMPVGIDTELFKKNLRRVSTDVTQHDFVKSNEKIKNSVLFLARMSPTKKPDLIIEALNILHKEGVDFTANFYGNPLPKDIPYAESLKEKVKEYQLSDRISFEKGIPNREAPAIYNAHEIFINPSPSGMYDKTIFEAMACESLILTSNLNLKGQIDDMFLFTENDEKDMAKQLKHLLSLDAETKEKYGKMLRVYVTERHSLGRLARELVKNLKEAGSV